MPERGNMILQLLGEERALIEPHLRLVHLQAGEVLCETGEDIRYVYFPESGAISKVTVFADGTEIECALIGRGGCLGALSVLGLPYALTRDVCHLPSEAWRIPVEQLRHACEVSPVLHDRFDRYCAWVMHCAIRYGACNAIHTVDRRLCRWLLTCSDALGQTEIPLSQDVFAKMLGVQRSSVSPILQKLRNDGLIELERGRLRLLNKAALLGRSCECYGEMRSAGRQWQTFIDSEAQLLRLPAQRLRT